MPHHLLTSSPTFPPPPAARHYHPTLSLWLSVDPMADKYPGVSPYTYCGNNPVRLVDPDGREVWHPDGEGGLIGDKGDNFSTLQEYLTTIYGDPTAISQNEWNSFQNQIVEYQNQNNTQDVEGIKLNSSSGIFDNLVGKYLGTMCQTNSMWALAPFESNNCSPTTFNRVDKATEFVYGKDILGGLTWSNEIYRAWQGNNGTSLGKFGTGVTLSLNLGIEVNDIQNGLRQGAILGLASKSAWHSAFFVDYIYDGNRKTGFRYWDQNEPYLHDCQFENGSYYIRRGVNFK
ncbi:MAG: hypothetical protein PUF10_06360 [Bacteroidales bacterium]|nr:hypothetical protein [Bacteroidales bacterium]